MILNPIRRPTAFLAFFLAAICAGPLCAAEGEKPKLNAHQSYIEDVMRETALNIADPLAVFEFVLSSLDERVKIYPTENYFYFTFLHNGVTYAGNIRIDASDRDRGFLNFAYVEESQRWRRPDEVVYRHLGAADGIKVEKLAALSYRVAYKDKAVIFDLNDLSNVKPPPGAMQDGEIYIGPVFDESGLQFYLLFNPAAKVFLYILNETQKTPEIFDIAKATDRIIIGRRTSFAFYKDLKLDRKILIGVYDGNTKVNNYFDGPFDQLPDNFLVGDTLKNAIIAILPDYADKIDRYGALAGGEERYAITPYVYYENPEDLADFHACAMDKTIPADRYYECFSAEQVSPPQGSDQPGQGAATGRQP